MEWQPIEAAPKDVGKLVLLFGGGAPFVGCWWEGGWKLPMGGPRLSPTHWHPLPESPAVISQDAKTTERR